MSIRLGEKLGEGGCSEVYEWEDQTKIIKLARSNTDWYSMNREFTISCILWGLGFPIPQPYELLDIDGRPGIVFERIYGETIMQRQLQGLMTAMTKPEENQEQEALEDVRLIARLLRDIHQHVHMELPSLLDHLRYATSRAHQLTEEEQSTILMYMEQLPLKQQICHGDPNPGNFIIHDGSPIIIDWMSAALGSPETDLAKYVVMIRYAVLANTLPEAYTNILNDYRELMIETFLTEYGIGVHSDISYADIDAWILPVAADKLGMDSVVEEEKQLLLQEVRARLARMA